MPARSPLQALVSRRCATCDCAREQRMYQKKNGKTSSDDRILEVPEIREFRLHYRKAREPAVKERASERRKRDQQPPCPILRRGADEERWQKEADDSCAKHRKVHRQRRCTRQVFKQRE